MHPFNRLALAVVTVFAIAAGVQAAPPTLGQLLQPVEVDMVRMSPDGRHIAAITRVKGRMMLAILDRATLKPVRVLDPNARGAVEDVRWVSNQRLFVVTSRTGRRVEEAYLDPWVVAIDLDGTRERSFAESVIDTLPDDDAHILVERCGRTRMAGCFTYVQRANNDGVPVGKKIAEAPQINASFMADNAGRVLVAYAYDDDDLQRVWRRVGEEWVPINDEATSGVETTPFGVTRDGAAVFLLSEQVDGPDVIERMEVASGERRVVLKDARLDPGEILMSADGTQPIGAAYGLGVPRARFFDDKDPDVRVIRALEKAFPEDAVRLVSGSRDGRHAVVLVSSDRDPGSFYLFDRDTRRTDLVGRMQTQFGPDVVAAAHPVAFKARDGLEIDGYLTLPLGGAKPPPLVVMPHGGPYEIADEWGYDQDAQVLAAHGYAVLRVNFRGSAGKGRRFVERGYQQWGAAMQDDLSDALQWARRDGRVDTTRSCIYGASYGGYAALMGAIREPDAYRCVVAASAVTDLNLQFRRGDIRRTRTGRAYLDRVLGRDTKLLGHRSPVSHAAAIKAPVLLVHGKYDVRVPFAHAQVMGKALGAAGVTYESWYPGDETHGIYGEENRKEFYDRLLAFLGRHLDVPASAAGAAP